MTDPVNQEAIPGKPLEELAMEWVLIMTQNTKSLLDQSTVLAIMDEMHSRCGRARTAEYLIQAQKTLSLIEF